MKYLILVIMLAVGCSTPFEPEQEQEIIHSEFSLTNLGYAVHEINGGYSVLVMTNVIRTTYGTDYGYENSPYVVFSAFVRNQDGDLILLAEDSTMVECAPAINSIDFVSKTLGFERPFQYEELSKTILAIRVRHQY